jgi:NTP pyrophosphatase (non-canonical NTP hydrolase)
VFTQQEKEILLEGLQLLDAFVSSPEEQEKLTELSAKVAVAASPQPPAFSQIEQFERACIDNGFGYRNKENAIAKFREEFEELLAAIESESKERQEEELGDLLYILTSVCRLYELSTGAAGEKIITKLQERIRLMGLLSPVPLGELSDKAQTNLLRIVKSSQEVQND